jgi:hypothetical protein
MHCRIIVIISIAEIGAGDGAEGGVDVSGVVVSMSPTVTISTLVSADAVVARSGAVVVNVLAATVDDESGFGTMRSAVVTESVVRVKIVYPDSVVAADVPGAAGSRLPGVASPVDLGLAARVFFLVAMVGLPM